MSGEQDSNLRSRKASDLQSDVFDRSTISGFNAQAQL